MLQDIVFALRSLRRKPSFALLVVAVLSIGIGTATAIATVYGGVILRRLPVDDQDRIVVMWGENRARKFDHIPLPYSRIREYRDQTRSLSSVGAIDYNGAYPTLFRYRGEPVEVTGLPVSGNFFDVLGSRALMGRILGPDDDVAGAPGNIVISHAVWQRLFGGDPSILGRSVQLVSTGGNFTIVGVMRPGFEYPKGAEFWASIGALSGARDPRAPVHVVARLKPGVSPEMARRELTTVFAQESSPMLRGASAVAETLPDVIVGDVRPALRILAVAVGLLLLVACVNVANLFLIRGVERARELAVRSALGAGRYRLARQLLTESSIIAIAAGVIGALLAILLLRMLLAAAPAELPRLGEIRIGGALAWAAVTTVSAAALFGIAPAFWTAGKRSGANLVGDSRWATERRTERRMKDILVAAQLALAIVILTSAGLVARSLVRLQKLELGYSTERLLVAQLGWPGEKYGDVQRAKAMYDAVIAEVQNTPGVVAAAPLLTTPFSGTGGWDGAFEVEDQSREAEARSPVLNMEVGTPNFFTTMGIPLRSGRVFGDRDRRGAPLVVMISDAAARDLWPGQDAVGKRIKLGAQATEWWSVIGVVADTRYREFRTPRATVYFPLQQLPFPYPPTNLVVRTANDPAAMTSALRGAIARVDPELIVARASTMTSLLDEPLAQPRLNALLLAVFAVVVLVLAAVGLYGVLAWTVRQRTRELGIRIALGAQPRQLSALVLRRGLLIAGAGAVAGLLGSIAVSRVMGALLFEVSPTDPVTIIASAGGLIFVAILATLTPARRAFRVDPMIAMRAE
jgi:putative ABC transport system permease protein